MLWTTHHNVPIPKECRGDWLSSFAKKFLHEYEDMPALKEHMQIVANMPLKVSLVCRYPARISLFRSRWILQLSFLILLLTIHVSRCDLYLVGPHLASSTAPQKVRRNHSVISYGIHLIGYHHYTGNPLQAVRMSFFPLPHLPIQLSRFFPFPV